MGMRRDKARNTSQQKCVPGHRLILVPGWESNQPVGGAGSTNWRRLWQRAIEDECTAFGVKKESG